MHIKPYRIFSHRGCWYLINIDAMRVFSTDAETADCLMLMLNEASSADCVALHKHLARFGLLGEGNSMEIRPKPVCQVPVTNMTLFVAQACNLNCAYCYGDQGRFGSHGLMTLPVAARAIDWLLDQSKSARQVRIGFLGGEPLLNLPTMKWAAAYALEQAQAVGKTASFYTTTNGTLLNASTIEFLRNYQFTVQVSLDGPKAIHDAQRPYLDGRGSYDDIVANVKQLLQMMPEADVHAVLGAGTDPAEVMLELKTIGFSRISILYASGSAFGPNQQPFFSEPRDTQELIKLTEAEAEEWLQLVADGDWAGLERLIQSSQLLAALTDFATGQKHYYPCGAGLGLVAVSVDGGVYACQRLVGINEFKLGNVFSSDICRDAYRVSPLVASDQCRDCFARYYCSGECKHDNYVSTGSPFHISEEICRLRRRQFEMAGYVMSNLDDLQLSAVVHRGILPKRSCILDF